MPLVWAGIRAGWNEAPADERKKLVEQFGDVEQVKQLAGRLGKIREEAKAKAGTTGDYLATMQQLQRQHQNYTMMSNILYTQHQASMAIIYNMGNGWTYSRR
jgi:hypothetical protein